MDMKTIYLAIPLSCLAGSIIAGMFGWKIGRRGAHTAAILGVGVSFLLSLVVAKDVLVDGNRFNGGVYTWAVSGGIPLEIGFLIDPLSATMMAVVSFVSLMVHIYTIGYMQDDPGYQRFFSYTALFTFFMLMLVMANNFLQLFFGWEGVGLVSYLLIGFWFERESAIHANLKAFLVNRMGDFGFILGIAVVYAYFQSLDYGAVFAIAPQLAGTTLSWFGGVEWNLITLICILLFIGAMGKSAQVPLHVWLPDSMEGPTPISALIHAATMVTAGVFMVARMSPLFELSETALAVVLAIGAITALFLGFVAIVQNDIKRVIAYSTISQLGYMMVGNAVSAYAGGIFHLVTHAFFKALLFLAAGSVIIALHHEQDMRKMGGLRRYMPATYWTALVGALALCGIPPFAGFFSKDAIIEAVHHSTLPGSGIAYVAVTLGVFVTAFYTFRMMFMTFHGTPRMEAEARSHVRESPLVVTFPLVMLAIPSVVAGAILMYPMLLGGLFAESIKVLPAHDVLGRWAQALQLPADFGTPELVELSFHGLESLPFFLAIAGILTAWLLYVRYPELPATIAARVRFLYTLLLRKYYLDEINEWVFAAGARKLGAALWRTGDVRLIDGLAVNGTARMVGWVAAVVRHIQTGYVYHYAFAMILGLFLLITFFLHR